MNDRAPSCGKGARFFDRRFSFPHFSQGGCTARNDDFDLVLAGSQPARSPCLIFWCFWIKPKAQKKKCTTEEIDSYFGKYPAPPIGRFLRGADLPPFVTERWRQKCPQGTSVGIGQRLSLSDHERLRLSHDRSGRSSLCPIRCLLRCNAEVLCAARNHDYFIS